MKIYTLAAVLNILPFSSPLPLFQSPLSHHGIILNVTFSNETHHYFYKRNELLIVISSKEYIPCLCINHIHKI